MRSLTAKPWAQPRYGRPERQYGAKLRERRQAAKSDEPQSPPAALAPEPEPQPATVTKLRPASAARTVEPPIGRNTAPQPRGREVPVAEMNGLLLKGITVLGDRSPTEIKRKGGASPTTLGNWKKHRVRSPLLETLDSSLHACGYRLAILDPDGNPI